MQHIISKTYFKMPACYITFTVVPAFLILCVVTADPFRLGEFFDMGQGLFSLNLSIVGAIALGTITILRMLLFILRKRLRMNWTVYILWCVGEMFFVSLFSSIYLRLMMQGMDVTFYDIMRRCLLQFLLIMSLPYTIITMGIQCYVLSHQKEKASSEESTLIRFHDDNKKLRFIIASEAVIYIKAEENYVRIRYIENGGVKDYTLRSSMRAIEESVTRHGLMRSHRSYYLNPAHVRLVRKDSAGLTYAEMDVDGVENVPISKNYYDSLSKIL